jgi:hypothetical protein
MTPSVLLSTWQAVLWQHWPAHTSAACCGSSVVSNSLLPDKMTSCACLAYQAAAVCLQDSGLLPGRASVMTCLSWDAASTHAGCDSCCWLTAGSSVYAEDICTGALLAGGMGTRNTVAIGDPNYSMHL